MTPTTALSDESATDTMLRGMSSSLIHVDEQSFLNDASDDGTLTAARPELVGLITASFLKMVTKHPGVAESTLLYLVVRDFLRALHEGDKGGSIAPLMFVYYLEVYRAAKLYREGEPALSQDGYCLAALSLFDLYLLMPETSTVRQMLSLASLSLQEAITQSHARRSDKVTQELMSQAASLALITQTVKDYTKRAHRRRNFPYIAWVKQFLTEAAASLDTAFTPGRVDVKHVITELTNRASKIIPPVTHFSTQH